MSIAELLASGFDNLTLTQSPRLRQMRTRLQRRNFNREVRELVSRAMTEAIANLDGEASATTDGLNWCRPEDGN